MRISCLATIFTAAHLSVAALFPDTVHGHGGGLDSYGCHHNRKEGGYYCHRGELKGRSFPSREEMLKAKKQEKKQEKKLK